MLTMAVAAAAGGMAAGGMLVQKMRRQMKASSPLMAALTRGKRPGRQPWVALPGWLDLPHPMLSTWSASAQAAIQSYGNKVQVVLTNINGYARETDNRYQQLIQSYLDPLLVSELRTQQIQELATAGREAIGEAEKMINRHLALGVTGIGIVALASLTALPVLPVAIGIGLYLSLPLYKTAWQRAVYDRQLRISHLLSIYVTGMWLGGAYLIGLIGVTFHFINQKMLAIVETRARQRLINVFGQQNPMVWRLVDDIEIEVPLAQIQVGDLVIVSAGQTISIDGTIVQGQALIDQRMLTGEAQPAEKEMGDVVLAATFVLGGKILIRVEKTGDATSAAQIGAILNRTATQRQRMEIQVIEIANRSLLPMLAGSILSGFLYGATAALAMLGCNFMISMMALGPLAMLQLLNRTSQSGILVKDGRALDILPTIDTVVFDKTGTLTLEQPRLLAIHTLPDAAGNESDKKHITQDKLLTLAAAAEQGQSHPLAQAIIVAAHERQLILPAIEHAEVSLGFGLKVRLVVDNEERNPEVSWERAVGIEPATAQPAQLIRIGSRRFMEMEGLSLPAALQAIQTACHEQAHLLVFVAIEDQVVGALELQTTLRPEARQLVQRLRQRQLDLYIISGDHQAPTQALAHELGITNYFANTLPEQKASRVAELQKTGRKVCFVGDGINDAIALRQADVSISLRGATTAATDTAQIVLMDEDLQQIDTLLSLSHEFNQRVKRMLNNASGFSLLSAGCVLFLNMGFTVVQLLSTFQLTRGVLIAGEEYTGD